MPEIGTSAKMMSQTPNRAVNGTILSMIYSTKIYKYPVVISQSRGHTKPKPSEYWMAFINL